MVRNSVFWKRIYLVVILLSCNCFLVCSNSFCEGVKKFIGCEGEAEEPKTNLEFNSKTNNNNLNLGGNHSPNENSIVFNILIVSALNHRVGKTSICKVAIGNNFEENEQPTKALDLFSNKNYIMVNSHNINIQLIDLASQPEYKSEVQNYFNKASAIVFVYDISNKDSFEGLGVYIEEVKNFYLEEQTQQPLFFLLGNKLDLAEGNKLDLAEKNEDTKHVSTEEAKNFVKDKKEFIFLGECSAKENTYIPDPSVLALQKTGNPFLEDYGKDKKLYKWKLVDTLLKNISHFTHKILRARHFHG